MAVEVTSAVLGKLGEAAARAAPEECCGILIGESGSIVGVIQTANVHASPRTHFEIDPQALIDTHRAMRRSRQYVIGYYHSHPNGPSRPSRADKTCSAGDSKVWAIIAPGKTTWWLDTPDGFTPLSLALAEG